MNVSEELQYEEREKIPRKLDNSWLKLDTLLLVFCSMACFGDGVEIYLPGMHNENLLPCIRHLTKQRFYALLNKLKNQSVINNLAGKFSDISTE